MSSRIGRLLAQPAPDKRIRGPTANPAPRPHPCPHPGCSKRYGTKAGLQRHVWEKHRPDGPRTYQCLDCIGTLSFADRSSLHNHMREQHQSQGPAPRARCGLCGVLITRRNMRRHRWEQHGVGV